MIEARSCERFAILAETCEDRELAKLYRGLYASEAGHYKLFLDLARALPAAKGVDERWGAMLEQEAIIIRRQPVGPSMHSGVV